MPAGGAVAALARLGGALQRFHDLGRRGKVRFADTEADDVLAGRLQGLRLFEQLDDLEGQEIVGTGGKAGHRILEGVLKRKKELYSCSHPGALS